MRWCSLHHHSTFSGLDGFGLPDAHVEVAAELGIKALALTEHGNVSSHVKLEMACEKNGAVQPIYGCEFYVRGRDEIIKEQTKNHITVLAKNLDGYRKLLRLMSDGWGDNFYYYPTVSARMIADAAQSGDLIVMSGCTGGELATHIVGGKNVPDEDITYKNALRIAEWWKENIPSGHYFLEVQQFPELEATRTINPALGRIAAKLGLQLVATGDCHYPRREDSFIQQILHNIRGGFREDMEAQAQRWGYNVPLCPPASDRELLHRLRDTGLSMPQARRSILAAEEIAQECVGVRLPKMPLLRYPLDGTGESSGTALLHRQLQEGWIYRGCHLLPGRERAAYKARLAKELGIIEEKDFVDYFLVVGDLVRWVKDEGIPVGPARGSAAASLLCWLLRIIEVNPMQFPNLVFERFIDISRADLPDIDLDFDSHQRHRIFEYLTAKYGEGHVANIGSFTQYKSKLALDDVARVFKVPPWEIKKVKEVLVERSSGDLRASAGIEDTVEQFEVARVVFDKYPDMQHAMTIEGQYKGIGVHASGIAVASVPIDQYVAIYKRWVESQKEMRDVLCFDKWDSERQGITKLDILGLNTMSMIADALRMLDMKLEDLYDLPLDDPATIDTFHRADLTGLFQFDGRAVRSVCAALNPDNFIELADITALARPGPLHNGATSMYIDIKKGAAQVKLVHPLYDQICAATHNLIVYQEQILRIVTEIGGFDWTAASYIRKIISKKLGEEEFNRQWDRFWDGAREREVPESVARAIWTNCITSGTYAFNFAHSVAYGMLAYWTGWLKTHHAQVFYAASLINTKVDKKKPKHFELMRDAVKHGIAIRPPAPGRSGLTWKPAGKKALRAGWMQVPGIGRSKAEAIISVRPSTYAECLAARGIGAKTIETIKAFGEGDDPFKLFDMERRIEEAKGQVRSMDGWLPEPTHDCYGIPHETTDEDTPVVWIGVILQRNLRDIFEVNKATQRPGADPETVKDPHLREWMILTGADGTEQAKFAIKRFNYPKYREMLWGIRLNEDVVLIAGKKSRTAGFRYVNIDRIWNLTPEEEEDDVAAEEQEVMA